MQATAGRAAESALAEPRASPRVPVSHSHPRPALDPRPSSAAPQQSPSRTLLRPSGGEDLWVKPRAMASWPKSSETRATLRTDLVTMRLLGSGSDRRSLPGEHGCGFRVQATHSRSFAEPQLE